MRGPGRTCRHDTAPGIVLAGLALAAIASTVAAKYLPGLRDLPGGGYYSTAWGVFCTMAPW